MAEPNPKGKTLWEMLMEKVRGNNNNGHSTAVSFNNPLDLRVGSPFTMAFANGPELADYNFTIVEIREYVRRMGGQEFEFTDYVLSGVHTKTFDVDQNLALRLRVLPTEAGGQEKLLLRLYDEFPFAQDFLEVLKDPSGGFETTDDESEVTDTFERVNHLQESYEAAVLSVAETTSEGQAAPKKTTSAKVEYWDYWRDMELGPGNTTKEFVFVEMNSETGWFQIWRGREFFA
jgi:hypothetical protein